MVSVSCAPSVAKRSVLFLCTGNSCRSQMAEGLLRHLAGDRFEVASAGIRPAGLHPLAVAAMKEIGIDISGHRSKSVAEVESRAFDYVITVCDQVKEECPFFPARLAQLHWGFDDPAAARGTEEEKLRVFRRVRDEIGDAIQRFLASDPKGRS